MNIQIRTINPSMLIRTKTKLACLNTGGDVAICTVRSWCLHLLYSTDLGKDTCSIICIICVVHNAYLYNYSDVCLVSVSKGMAPLVLCIHKYVGGFLADDWNMVRHVLIQFVAKACLKSTILDLNMFVPCIVSARVVML